MSDKNACPGKKSISLSHERCKKYEISYNQTYSNKILNEKELFLKMEDSRELILASAPIMNEIYNFVKGSNFFSILTDNEGCILNVIGDEDILTEAFSFKMIPGAYMDEKSIGTNAMGTALEERSPIQVSGSEHFINVYHRWTCSACPIKDMDGNIIGVLDLTGYSESVHSHTLGMVVAGAKAIENELIANYYKVELSNEKKLQKKRKMIDKINNGYAIYTFDKIVGQDKNFLNVINYAKKIANSRSNILIMGESGTGKELFAQSIHNSSNRALAPFIAINCGAIPINLIEAELFGYEEGSFTGAKAKGNPGKFEIADGGTVFLDEIGEMPLDLQTRLLRVIEEGTISRIGSSKVNVVDVRIIAATNKNLIQEVENGTFRKDLFYRLNVLPLRLPSLRERKNDITLLIEYFMDKISKKLDKKKVPFSSEAIEKLSSYDWPGNIRELENYIELAINTEELPDISNLKINNYDNIDDIMTRPSSINLCSLRDLEKQHIINVLKTTNNNITQAANILAVGRNTLYRKMREYEITVP